MRGIDHAAPRRHRRAGCIALLIGGAFAGLIVEGARDLVGRASRPSIRYLLRVARFTLWQAVLSTLLSVVPALFVARALSRHPRFPRPRLHPAAFRPAAGAAGHRRGARHPGALRPRRLFRRLFSAVGGQSWPGIYGLSGILVAHVFFNLPLATRLFLEALETVPADQWRLASQLGMGARPAFRLIEWPALRAALPGVAGLVFMLCITSFTIVLTLGGGPRATTLEVAIYQALRFDFDPARAVTLTLLQIALTFVVVLALTRLGANVTGDANLPVAPRRYLSAGTAETALNAALIVLALLFVAGPMAATVVAGLDADLGRLAGESAVRQATLTSAGARPAVGAAFGGAVAVAGHGAAGAGAAPPRRRRVAARTCHRHRRRLRAGRAADRHRRRLVPAAAPRSAMSLPSRRSWSSPSTR